MFFFREAARHACSAREQLRRPLLLTLAAPHALYATGNPLKIGDPDAFAEENGIFPFSDEQVIGFFRHAEIKHGRIAMAAFIGFLVGESRAHFPWMLSGEVSFADIAAAGGPGAQWDALGPSAKYQIFSFIFLMEAISESTYAACLQRQTKPLSCRAVAPAAACSQQPQPPAASTRLTR